MKPDKIRAKQKKKKNSKQKSNKRTKTIKQRNAEVLKFIQIYVCGREKTSVQANSSKLYREQDISAFIGSDLNDIYKHPATTG